MPEFKLRVPVDITTPGYDHRTVTADTLEEASAIAVSQANNADPDDVSTDDEDPTASYVSAMKDAEEHEDEDEASEDD